MRKCQQQGQPRHGQRPPDGVRSIGDDDAGTGAGVQVNGFVAGAEAGDQPELRRVVQGARIEGDVPQGQHGLDTGKVRHRNRVGVAGQHPPADAVLSQPPQAQVPVDGAAVRPGGICRHRDGERRRGAPALAPGRRGASAAARPAAPSS